MSYGKLGLCRLIYSAKRSRISVDPIGQTFTKLQLCLLDEFLENGGQLGHGCIRSLVVYDDGEDAAGCLGSLKARHANLIEELFIEIRIGQSEGDLVD